MRRRDRTRKKREGGWRASDRRSRHGKLDRNARSGSGVGVGSEGFGSGDEEEEGFGRGLRKTRFPAFLCCCNSSAAAA